MHKATLYLPQGTACLKPAQPTFLPREERLWGPLAPGPLGEPLALPCTCNRLASPGAAGSEKTSGDALVGWPQGQMKLTTAHATLCLPS